MLIYLKNLENSPDLPPAQLCAADPKNTSWNRPKKQVKWNVNLQIFLKAASKNIPIFKLQQYTATLIFSYQTAN